MDTKGLRLYHFTDIKGMYGILKSGVISKSDADNLCERVCLTSNEDMCNNPCCKRVFSKEMIYRIEFNDKIKTDFEVKKMMYGERPMTENGLMGGMFLGSDKEFEQEYYIEESIKDIDKYIKEIYDYSLEEYVSKEDVLTELEEILEG